MQRARNSLPNRIVASAGVPLVVRCARVVRAAVFPGRAGRRGPAAEEMPDVAERWRDLAFLAQELLKARDPDSIHRLVTVAARRIAAADGAAFIRLEDGECHYAAEDADAPLWKGVRVPMARCISGASMLHRVPIVIEDIQHDPRILPEMYRSTFVRSLAMVPVRKDEALGAIGVYWAIPHRPEESQLSLLQTLGDMAAAALENLARVTALGKQVEERTLALETAYKDFQQLALIDDLTGLRNRRGFFLLAQQQRRQVARSGEPAFIVFIDVDDLKQVNDTLGHDAGDQLLRITARVLQATFRESDIVARLGGDEFCVLAVDGICNPQMIRDRLLRNIGAFNAGRVGCPFPLSVSIGIHPCAPNDPTPLEQLVRCADQDMYVQKRFHHRATSLAVRREPGRSWGPMCQYEDGDSPDAG